MATVRRSLNFLLVLFVSSIPLAFPEDENQFIYNGFRLAKLHLDGIQQIHPSGMLQLTNLSIMNTGHAFYPFPIRFKTSSSSTSCVSFSTNFVFAIVPRYLNLGCDGMAFTIAPSTDFTHSSASGYLGLFNASNNGLLTNHILAIELDTFKNTDLGDLTNNDVGIDVNNIMSIVSTPAKYGDQLETSLKLTSGDPICLWIDYDEAQTLLSVRLAPTETPKPEKPLLSKTINMSKFLLEHMYVGFSSATGYLLSDHYILGLSFNTSGPAQSLDVSSVPSLPLSHHKKKREKPRVQIVTSLIVAAVLLITIPGVVYIFRRKDSKEVHEEWEDGYGLHRFIYKELHNATQGFRDTKLLGTGGFGKVYSGTLPLSNVQVAIKKVSHNSKQGMKEFVAEIVSMGRMRHRNLVRLLGYCRQKRELLLVYDYMPNGSLDNFCIAT